MFHVAQRSPTAIPQSLLIVGITTTLKRINWVRALNDCNASRPTGTVAPLHKDHTDITYFFFFSGGGVTGGRGGGGGGRGLLFLINLKRVILKQ